LKHCRAIGAGGARMMLKTITSEQAARLRDLAAASDMFIDGILRPPRDESDLSRFEAEIKTVREVSVQAVRTVIIPGRRYEQFDSFEAFQAFERRGRRMVELATPIVEKHQVPLAIENHKDQRIEDRLSLYQNISSEYVGQWHRRAAAFGKLVGRHRKPSATQCTR
jgi:3-oxoisoapionate decarboxylase